MRQASSVFNNAAKCDRERQIGYVLLVQALCPLFVSVLPIVILLAAAIADVSSLELSRPMTMLFNWTPLINAMGTLLIVRPYRIAVFGSRGNMQPSVIAFTNQT